MVRRLVATSLVLAIALAGLGAPRGRTARADGPLVKDVCAPTRPAVMRCFAVQHMVVQPDASSPSFPAGFHPADLQAGAADVSHSTFQEGGARAWS